MQFKKDFSTRSRAQIKSSEKRRIKAQLDIPQLDETFKADMHLAKIVTHAGVKGCIYSVNNQPLFITLDDLPPCMFIPTVYTLWISPYLPQLYTHMHVINKLRNGADLFIAGVHIPESAFPVFEAGDLVSICNEHGTPLAVGTAVKSSVDMVSMKQGAAVMLQHVIGDAVWQSGDKSQPIYVDENAGFQDVDPPLDGNLQSLDIQGAPEQLSTKEMDDLLQFSFMVAIGDIDPNDKILPITASLFYSSHILKSRPNDCKLDMKRTSFKKIGKFLKAMDKKGFVKTKERNGELVITHIVYEHLINSGFIAPKKRRASISAPPASIPERIKVTIFYKPSPALSAVLIEVDKDYTRDKTYTAQEIKMHIDFYSKRENLIKRELRGKIQLDHLLSHIFPTDADYMTPKALVESIISSQQSRHSITLTNKTPPITIHQGLPLPILISVKNRGSKVTSLVSRCERYGIDPVLLCAELKIKCACSTSIIAAEGSKGQGVLVQGSRAVEIAKVLETWGVPGIKFLGKNGVEGELIIVEYGKGVK